MLFKANIFLLLFSLVYFPAILLADEMLTKCFKGSEEEPTGHISFSCPKGSVISITEAVIGRNAWMECVLTDEDCIQPTRIFQMCQGQTNCSRHFKTYSARCGYITIVLLNYKCIRTVPVTPTAQVTLTDDSPRQDYTHGSRVGGDHSEARPTWRSKAKPETEESTNNDEEIGLVVATILAAFLTAFMLIVAIIMTVRRLLDYPSRNRRGNGGSSNRLAVCLEGICVQVDRFPCFHGPSDLSGQESLRSQKSNASCPRDQVAQRSSHRRRMAPIGQESSDNADPSREREQEREETENTHVRIEPRTSGPSLTYEDENDANVLAERRAVGLHHEAFQKRLRGPSSYNDRVQSHDKLGRWNTKNIAGQGHDAKIANNNNNNNHILGVVGSYPFDDGEPRVVSIPTTSSCKDTPAVPSSSLELELNTTSHARPSPAGNNIHPDLVPRFDAIVVPNTETSSKC